MNQVKFLVTIFPLTLLAAKGQGAAVNLTANVTMDMFNSPNYPNNYDSNLNCVWIITAAEGCTAVEVTFTNFSIEANFDSVKIRDGGLESSDQIVCITVSLDFLPKTVTSTGTQIWIQFESDGSEEVSGFKANYRAINCTSQAGWNHWGQWSECSECCGTGNQTRMRTCTNPPPSGMGDDCVGDPIENRECNKHPCTVNCTGLQFTADFRYEPDCKRFYRCENDMLTCPICGEQDGNQLWFDPRINMCNLPCAVNCTTACGIRPIANNRIVGGSEAPVNGWPWQAQLINKYLCGGTLIGRYWVLTAARCFDGDNTSPKIATLGAFFLPDRPVGTEQKIEIQKVILHPNYDTPVRFAHDVALLKLAQPAVLNKAVGLACLPSGNVSALEPGKQCYITGWGNTAENGSVSQTLRQASVPIRSDMECSQAYPGQIHESMLCAGLDQGGVDTCQSDSGGPLVCEHSGKYYIEGITSWGNGCARPNFYGVYADVRNLMDWILETIENH